MATSVQLTCGTLVPVALLDELAWASLGEFLCVPHDSDIKSAAGTYIRRLDKEGKLLDKLEEVLGWTPPS